MRVARFALLAAFTLAALPSPASLDRLAGKNRAVILPEVQRHLDDAKECTLNGTPQVAAAHADLVLLGDEVRYSVQFVGVSEKLRARCLKSLEGALDSWERALDDTVSFREVTDPNEAEIVIRFKPNVMMGKEPVAGYANWKRTLHSDGPKVNEVKFRADLQIRTINLDGQPMALDCVRHEIAHEVGHILGLEDSDSTSDLMGPLDTSRPMHRPQPYEAQAVKKLREEARKIRTDALAKAQA